MRIVKSPLLFLLIKSLSVLTARSANPLDSGLYGIHRLCFIPFLRQNSLNFVDVNCDPFSFVISAGRPNVPKQCYINMKLQHYLILNRISLFQSILNKSQQELKTVIYKMIQLNLNLTAKKVFQAKF